MHIKIQFLKSDIEKNWISCAVHLNSIIGIFMSNRNYIWILNKLKITNVKKNSLWLFFYLNDFVPIILKLILL